MVDRKLIIALLLSVLGHIAILSPALRPWLSVGLTGESPRQVLQVRINTVSPAVAPNEQTSTVQHHEDLGGSSIPNHVAPGELTEQPSLLGTLPDVGAVPSPESGGAKAVALRLIIGAEGRVVYLQVLQSSVPRAVEEQVVQAFYQANYRPGRVGTRAVTAEMLVSVSIE